MKETILKEFDEKFNWEEFFGKNSRAEMAVRQFISNSLDQYGEQQYQKGLKDEKAKWLGGLNVELEDYKQEQKIKIGQLRQWLNERTKKRLITDEDIIYWLK
jgi:hypothetical protein